MPRFAFPTWAEWKPRLWLLLKSSIIGSFIGVLPGTGSSAAAFISYGEAKRSSPRSANMGKGEPDGIVAPEAANNAVTGGALVPSLALGLPGDAVTAVMIATLIIHGVTPGVRLMVDSPSIVYGIFLSLILACILIIPVGYAVARALAYMLKLPEALLCRSSRCSACSAPSGCATAWSICEPRSSPASSVRCCATSACRSPRWSSAGPRHAVRDQPTPSLFHQPRQHRDHVHRHPIAIFLVLVTLLLLFSPLLHAPTRGCWPSSRSPKTCLDLDDD